MKRLSTTATRRQCTESVVAAIPLGRAARQSEAVQRLASTPLPRARLPMTHLRASLRARHDGGLMAPKGTTQRVSDGGAVDLDDAKQAWADAARPVLKRVAGSYNLYIEHKDLAESVQQDTGITTGVLVHHWIGSVPAPVARHRRAPDEPMLSSLCVRTDGTVGSDYRDAVLERERVRPSGSRPARRRGTPRVYRYFARICPLRWKADADATAQGEAESGGAPARARRPEAMPDLLHRSGGLRGVRDLWRVTATQRASLPSRR